MPRPPTHEAHRPTTLPSGRHGISPETIREHQRQRILTATVVLCGGTSYEAASVHRIARAARVAERCIYEHYPEGRRAVLAAAFEHLGRELIARAGRAATAKASFDEGIGAAVRAVTEMFAADPAKARFLLLEAPASGRAIAELRSSLLARLAEALHDASVARRGYTPPAPDAALFAVGGVSHVLATMVAADQTSWLAARTDDLTASLLTLYG